jgi:hypothetical protein
MKKIFTFSIVLFSVAGIQSQQIVINDKLLSQITVNHGVRLASEQAFLDSYKSKKNYTRILKTKQHRSLRYRNTSISS